MFPDTPEYAGFRDLIFPARITQRARLITGATLSAAGGGYAADSIASAADIFDGGDGYAVGDTITLTGGTFSTATVLIVANENGGVITDVDVMTPGVYSVLPGNPVAQGATSGAGTGALFDLTYTFAGDTLTFIGTAGQDTVLQVTEIGGGGAIVDFTVLSLGADLEPPSNPAAPDSTSGVGAGATFVLAYGTTYYYSWEEQNYGSDGLYGPVLQARTGNAVYNPAIHLNNLIVPAGTYVWLRLRTGVGGSNYYDFEEWLLGSADVFGNSDTATTKLTYLGTGGITVTLSTAGEPGDDTLTFHGSSTAGTGIDVVGDGVSDTHHCVGDSTIHFINSKIACGPGDATVTSRERFYLNSSSASFAVEPGIDLVAGTGITINGADDTVNSRGQYLISATGSASTSLTVRDQQAHVVTGTSTITMVNTAGSNTFTVSGGAGAASISLAIAAGSSSVAFHGARFPSGTSRTLTTGETRDCTFSVSGGGNFGAGGYDNDGTLINGGTAATISVSGHYHFTSATEWNASTYLNARMYIKTSRGGGDIITKGLVRTTLGGAIDDDDTFIMECSGDYDCLASDTITVEVKNEDTIQTETLQDAMLHFHRIPTS